MKLIEHHSKTVEFRNFLTGCFQDCLNGDSIICCYHQQYDNPTISIFKNITGNRQSLTNTIIVNGITYIIEKDIVESDYNSIIQKIDNYVFN